MTTSKIGRKLLINRMRNGDVCPYIYRYLKVRVPCAFPEKKICGLQIVDFEKSNFVVCQYRVYELGKRTAITEISELLGKHLHK